MNSDTQRLSRWLVFTLWLMLVASVVLPLCLPAVGEAYTRAVWRLTGGAPAGLVGGLALLGVLTLVLHLQSRRWRPVTSCVLFSLALHALLILCFQFMHFQVVTPPEPPPKSGAEVVYGLPSLLESTASEQVRDDVLALRRPDTRALVGRQASRPLPVPKADVRRLPVAEPDMPTPSRAIVPAPAASTPATRIEESLVAARAVEAPDVSKPLVAPARPVEQAAPVDAPAPAARAEVSVAKQAVVRAEPRVDAPAARPAAASPAAPAPLREAVREAKAGAAAPRPEVANPAPAAAVRVQPERLAAAEQAQMESPAMAAAPAAPGAAALTLERVTVPTVDATGRKPPAASLTRTVVAEARTSLAAAAAPVGQSPSADVVETAVAPGARGTAAAERAGQPVRLAGQATSVEAPVAETGGRSAPGPATLAAGRRAGTATEPGDVDARPAAPLQAAGGAVEASSLADDTAAVPPVGSAAMGLGGATVTSARSVPAADAGRVGLVRQVAELPVSDVSASGARADSRGARARSVDITRDEISAMVNDVPRPAAGPHLNESAEARAAQTLVDAERLSEASGMAASALAVAGDLQATPTPVRQAVDGMAGRARAATVSTPERGSAAPGASAALATAALNPGRVKAGLSAGEGAARPSAPVQHTTGAEPGRGARTLAGEAPTVPAPGVSVPAVADVRVTGGASGTRDAAAEAVVTRSAATADWTDAAAGAAPGEEARSGRAAGRAGARVERAATGMAEPGSDGEAVARPALASGVMRTAGGGAQTLVQEAVPTARMGAVEVAGLPTGTIVKPGAGMADERIPLSLNPGVDARGEPVLAAPAAGAGTARGGRGQAMQVAKASLEEEGEGGGTALPVGAAAGAGAVATSTRAPARVLEASAGVVGAARVGIPDALPADARAQTYRSVAAAEMTASPQLRRQKLIYSLRSPEKRRALIRELGGSEDTERAVERALTWLATVQSADGHWDVNEFRGVAQCGGAGDRTDGDVGVTGLALLAYLGAGYTQDRGDYRDPIRKALDWLIAGQEANGDLRRGGQLYVQAMATAALCESFSLTGDERLREPARRAVQFIMEAQNPEAGWRYEPREDSDTSVTGWQVLALKSAEIAGFTVPPQHFAWTARWLEKVRRGPAGGLYAYKEGHGPTPVMTAEGWFCQLFMGQDERTRGTDESMRYVMENLPVWDPGTRGVIHYYYWYYATLAMHLSGVPEFEVWNQALRVALLKGQRTSGPAKGSWDPVDQLGERGGRLYSTTMATLCLEVYYRYLPFYHTEGP
ncbi:MAG: hypothetical protein K8T26_09925 [Lentisphaerae bacterium]|nr:hypothetical protein [Lentisphaerota bacterium]